MSLAELMNRLSSATSVQGVVGLALASGLVLILARSDALATLSSVGAYLAAGISMARETAPELALVTLAVGIFTGLVMQLTASDRRSDPSRPRVTPPTTMAVRLLMALLLLWLALSLGLFGRPLDPWRFVEAWLALSAVLSLMLVTDPLRVGLSLLMLCAAGMLYFASSSADTSLLVQGLIAVAAMVISLSSSHLALLQDAPEAQ